MTEKIKKFTGQFTKKAQPDVKVGDTVKVHQKIPASAASTTGKKTAKGKEGDKERTQVFEGVVLAIKHGRGIQGTITVRRIISGIGVERTFPFHSPLVEKIEIVSRGKVRRAKLYYLRDRVGKKAKLKRRDYTPGEETIEEAPEQPTEAQPQEPAPTGEPKQEKVSPEPQKEEN